MSHTGVWAVKDPDEVKDYVLDWAGSADDQKIAYGDALTSSTWIVPSGITKNSDSLTSGTTTIWLSGGTAGVTYSFTNRVTTTGGRTYDESIKLKVKNK